MKKNMKQRCLDKQLLYESVKTLVETDHNHIHLNQHKLYTLFSIAFQYFLFYSTKNPGAYIIRIEDTILADKIVRKAKDPSTRKFIEALLIPRRLKYQKSTFYLDFFHLGTWGFTNEIPKERLKGALVVKSTTAKPMCMLGCTEDDEPVDPIFKNLPPNYFLTSIQSLVPKMIVIGHECEFENTQKVEFPFIVKDQDRNIPGVKLANSIDLNLINS